MAIMNLMDAVLEASGLDVDDRWARWAKYVDSVDVSRSNGYCFVGSFVPDGAVEVNLSVPRVILVMSESGSRKYRTKHYQVVKIGDNRIEAVSGLRTTGDERGWALRLRDGAISLLDELNGTSTHPLDEFDIEVIIQYLEENGYKVS